MGGRDAPPVGLLQYRPIPAERAIFIYCIFVPDRIHWRKGAASRLLADLIREAREPQTRFDDQPAACW